MYNLRYHIASLVAVFLALAIGLVLGSVVGDRGDLTRQQQSLVKSLQTSFTGLKQENEDLRRDRDREHAFAVDVLPTMLNGILRGKTVLIIANAGREDGLTGVRDTIRSSGGDTQIATFKAKGFGREDPQVDSALSAIATRTAGRTGGSDPAVLVLASEWTHPDQPQPMTDALKQAGQLSVEGSSTAVAPDAVVLLASFDGQADPALVAVAASMSRAGVPVVGVETESAQTGVADAGIGAGLSTVDDVDRPEGALSLVYILGSRADGHFGVKPGASAPYPKLR